MTIDGLERFLSDEENMKLGQLLECIPERKCDEYLKRISGSIHKSSPVNGFSRVQGVLFELLKMEEVMNQGLEVIDFGVADLPEVEFLGYKKPDNLSKGPTTRLSSKIDFDIPLKRGNKLYVLELKNYPRMQFGESAEARNQLLKYQAAIRQGIVAGATIEIKGRIHPSFLDWITSGLIPDVEVVYLIELPSGAWYRFVIKPSKNGNGLKFTNQTPYTEEDKEIIDGVERVIYENRAIEVIRGIEVKNVPEDLSSYIINPRGIRDINTLKRCLPIWQEAIWQAFQ